MLISLDSLSIAEWAFEPRAWPAPEGGLQACAWGHYLTVRQWSPNFHPVDDSFKKVIAS